MSFIRKKLSNSFLNRNKNSPETYKIPVEDYNSILCQAIRTDNCSLELIKPLLKHMKSVNAPIITAGPFSGFTALHVACMAKKGQIIRLLVEDFKADVNVLAKDETQPIHILCFFCDDACSDVIKILATAGANVNAEFGKEIFYKYLADRRLEWSSEFGEKMNLLTYAVVYNISDQLVEILLMCRANYRIKSITNKTLLMHAAEENNITVALYLICDAIRDTEFISARDNEGLTAINYILHPKKFGEFRYTADISSSNVRIYTLLQPLINCGPYIDPLIKNDPKSFILNTAAFRASQAMLENLLPYYHSYTPITHFRALYYATLPVEDPNHYVLIPNYQLHRAEEIRNKCETRRRSCIGVILIDLAFRLTFGLPVPSEEIKLMDQILETDVKFREFVDEYKRDIIDRKLMKQVIKLNKREEDMTLYEFMLQIYDDKKLNKLLKRHENLLLIWKGHTKYHNPGFPILHFMTSVSTRIRRVDTRMKLMKILEKISNLREHIPLPYEIVLDIVDFLSNNELEFFIKAFLSSYPNYIPARNVLDPTPFLNKCKLNSTKIIVDFEKGTHMIMN